MNPTPGIYRHYKGGEYRVLFVVGDSTNARAKEDENDKILMVVYLSLKNGKIWVRDLEEFVETVEFEGKSVPRFSLVREA